MLGFIDKIGVNKNTLMALGAAFLIGYGIREALAIKKLRLEIKMLEKQTSA